MTRRLDERGLPDARAAPSRRGHAGPEHARGRRGGAAEERRALTVRRSANATLEELRTSPNAMRRSSSAPRAEAASKPASRERTGHGEQRSSRSRDPGHQQHATVAIRRPSERELQLVALRPALGHPLGGCVLTDQPLNQTVGAGNGIAPGAPAQPGPADRHGMPLRLPGVAGLTAELDLPAQRQPRGDALAVGQEPPLQTTGANNRDGVIAGAVAGTRPRGAESGPRLRPLSLPAHSDRRDARRPRPAQNVPCP